MGYRIDYVPPEYGRNAYRSIILPFLVGCLFWVVVYCCWPAGRTFVYRYLIPEKCVEAFVSDLQEGGTLLTRIAYFLRDHLWGQ